MSHPSTYIGRFAPSPSGPLHFGSLIAALGSYFQAKSQQGKWLVRIEDLDPPREMVGADTLILKTLENYGLYWDDDVVYQSHRHHIYQAQIDEWLQTGRAYYCQCSRKQIKQDGGFYLGHCRNKNNLDPLKSAVRLYQKEPVQSFHDEILGQVNIPSLLAHEDFIIKRRDGLFAYNLAVVLDDIAQGVTQVVRGQDLIEPTGRQISLYKTLGCKPIRYLHLPLALDEHGNKLSKQNHAPAILTEKKEQTLAQAMLFLGFKLPQGYQDATHLELLSWGVKHWKVEQLTHTNSSQID